MVNQRVWQIDWTYYRKCSNFLSEQGSRKNRHLEQDWL